MWFWGLLMLALVLAVAAMIVVVAGMLMVYLTGRVLDWIRRNK